VVVIEPSANGGTYLDGPNLAFSRGMFPTIVTPDQSEFDFGALLPTHPNPFVVGGPDSGAVMVGAGYGWTQAFLNPPPPGAQPDRSRDNFSNFGSRLDVQAWGENIVTTGYSVCDQFGTVATNNCYTSSFSGTSGASAIIAGVVAQTQGILKAAGRRPLNSQEFRALFKNPSVGHPQTDAIGMPVIERIGQRPDMDLLPPVALAMAALPPVVGPITRPP
jgi:hypothetical protein